MIISTTKEINENYIKLIAKRAGMETYAFSSINKIPDELAAKAEILLTFGTDLTNENIIRFPAIKWIQLLSVGAEELPHSVIIDMNIMVSLATGIHIKPMSEYVLYCLLHFEKDMDRYQQMKSIKQYDRSKEVGELSKKTVLIYGTGMIGKEIARVLSLFNMKVYGVNTSGKNSDPYIKTFQIGQEQDQLQTADYIISVLPSTPLTRGYFSKALFEKMKQEAVFVNIGRGDVIEEEAVLVDRLRQMKLRGAALDVFKEEPLPAYSPLWEMPNVILTPHMSAKSMQYIDRCMDIFLENLHRYKNGKQLKFLLDLAKQY